MTITIGSFTCNALTAQPYGYEGDPSEGLTARTFLVSGLLTANQWSALLSVYNTWRNARINDPDTLYANNVGTTVSLSITSANGISVTSLACWFTETPSGDQFGNYISATATLVDAAQALAVLKRAQAKQKERSIAEDSDVNCAQIAARLQRQKDETDCELVALGDGLADDFAAQALAREGLDAAAKAGVYSTGSAALESIAGDQAAVELAEKQAQLAGRATSVQSIAAVDLSLEAQVAGARAGAYADDVASLEAIKGAEANIELLDKQAQVTARAAVADDIAQADFELDAQSAQARAAALTASTATLEALKAAEASVELLEKQATLAGRAANADDIAAIDLELETQTAEAQSAAYTANSATLASLRAAQAAVELKGREADVTARAAVAPDMAVADLSLQAIDAAARADAYAAGGADLATIKSSDAAVELADREATVTARAAVADDLAAAELSLQALEATARVTAAAANTTALEDIQAAAFATEQLEAAAKVAALTGGTTLEDVRAARALQAIYDKYLGEDLPDLGSLTIGTVTVKLVTPMDTYSDGPQVSLTAGGGSLITGPLKAHQTRRIEGILTSGTYDTLLSWYNTTISSKPGVGTWFPTIAPTAVAEKFLVNGAVATRYSVSLEMKKIV